VSIPQEILGTIPGWITSAGVLGILGLVIRWQLGLKKLAIEAQQVSVNAKKVDNEDRADARDHIAEEMVALRNNVKSLREELHTCEEDCRQKIEALREELWGEKQQRVAEQISLINLVLKSVDAPALKTLLEALERTQTHLMMEVRK
jgi:hypothetical protein